MHKPMIKLVAYLLGEKIQLKNFKAVYQGAFHFISSYEVYIKKGEYAYIYIQNSGEIAFSDCDETTINEFITFIRPFVDMPVLHGKEYKEDCFIDVNPEQKLHFDYNSFIVPEINADVIKIALLNVCQSVALDYFTDLSQGFLHETVKFTNELELKGKLTISNTKVMKFIGKTMNIQNRITDNLYFMDAPDTVWDNEYLSHINNGLSKIFNLKTRFREVEYTLKIIDNNLRTFAQLVQNRDNKKLELIIIFLIFFEILNTLFGKFFLRF